MRQYFVSKGEIRLLHQKEELAYERKAHIFVIQFNKIIPFGISLLGCAHKNKHQSDSLQLL